jgi:hypothetical protein
MPRVCQSVKVIRRSRLMRLTCWTKQLASLSGEYEALCEVEEIGGQICSQKCVSIMQSELGVEDRCPDSGTCR